MPLTRGGRAFSLIELLLSAALLSLMMLLLFLVFRDGTRTFYALNVRQGLEGEARRCSNALEQSLRQADLNLCQVINTPARQRLGLSGATISRDGLSYAGLSHWWDAALFNASGRPQWDQYEVIYATLYNPGQLVRQIYKPGGAPYQVPLPGFSVPTMLNDQPGDNVGFSETHLLSKLVEDFQVQLDGNLSSADIQLILSDREFARAGSQRASQERLQINLSVKLNNTQP